MSRFSVLSALAMLLLSLGPDAFPARAQELPLAPLRGQGQGVWPVFEGWYDNPDGTYTIYFGYQNRNADQVLDIPLGERNFIEPAELDGAQPTRFETLRHWGVFGIPVPAGQSPQDRIYWNLVVDGRTYRVPGHLQAEWKTDALGGGATGNTPPVLRFGAAEGRGPLGVTASTTVRARVGEPVELSVAATDEAASGPDLAAAFGGGRGGPAPQVTLAWFKHQGPGDVVFSRPTGRVPASGGELTTMATFDAPGDHVVRVRATDAAVAAAGHAQCCWTNGFVNVTVTR